MNILKYIAIAFASVFLTQCGSSQIQLMETPFEVDNAYFQKWMGGAPGSGTGINVFLPIKSISPEIQLERAAFRGKIAQISLDSQYTYVARFMLNPNQGDVIMSGDVQQEAANTPPNVTTKEDFPFALSENEVGIIYVQKGKTLYTKVSNLKEKETIAYPSAPPRDGGL